MKILRTFQYLPREQHCLSNQQQLHIPPNDSLATMNLNSKPQDNHSPSCSIFSAEQMIRQAISAALSSNKHMEPDQILKIPSLLQCPSYFRFFGYIWI